MERQVLLIWLKPHALVGELLWAVFVLRTQARAACWASNPPRGRAAEPRPQGQGTVLN
jgi:hypothetical protein